MKNNHVIDWREAATLLAKNSTMSWRAIAKSLSVPKSTCSDLLRKQMKGQA